MIQAHDEVVARGGDPRMEGRARRLVERWRRWVVRRRALRNEQLLAAAKWRETDDSR